MQFLQDEKLHGFRIIRVRDSAELSGRLMEMIHEKTGARLCWLDNGAENKVFSIAFRTLPWDNTGVFHILEHSVLCGSEKHPCVVVRASLSGAKSALEDLQKMQQLSRETLTGMSEYMRQLNGASQRANDTLGRISETVEQMELV
ncbi:MAG: hypothetical protein IKD50_07920, partial [Clostridia bacterium]|nr:hypothetical protein [Clostridia bacterium]